MFLALASVLIVAAQSAVAKKTGRVEVTPECNRETITVRIQFDGHYFTNGKFTDWIIVGDSGRETCRLQGNGELQYIVQIAVFNDPCGTKRPAPGEFENTLRIAQFPGVILSEDLHFTFKCVYGQPTVDEYQLPQVSPSFDVNRNLITSELSTSPPDLHNIERPDQSDPDPHSDFNQLIHLNNLNKDDPTRSADISRASNNLLAILLSAFVVVGILVFLLIVYICLRQWQHRKSRHDQIHTDSETPSSTSPGIVNQDEEGSWWNAKTIQSGYVFGSSFKSKNFESRKKGMAPVIPPYSAGSLNFEIERAVDIGITTNNEHNFHQAFRNGNNSSDEHENGKSKAPQSYAAWRETVLKNKNATRSPQNDHQLTLDRKLDSSEQLDIASGCLTPVRSITEIYRSAETRLQKLIANQPDDNNSESSIEGEYSIPIQQPLDKTARDSLANCVNKIRGFGARKLTEQEIGRWKQLINNDVQLQTQIIQARNLEDLRGICKLPEYKLFFTQTKWAEIIRCLDECLQQRQEESLGDQSSTLNTRPFRTTAARSNW